jgi:formamidopyrimidine-DNA glycosylase
MPELPEVEVIRRRIAPIIESLTIIRVHVNSPKLRLPIPANITSDLADQKIIKVDRRGKYLLLRCTAGTLILHLGMTGDVRMVAAGTSPGRHDHLDIDLTGGIRLRFNDPRRFGSVLWTEKDPLGHPLLQKLGPEPLSDAFTASCLFLLSRGRKISIKQFMMDGTIVSGLGNIYTNEALLRAGIHPKKEAGSLSAKSFERLTDSVREVLLDAIEDGIAAANSPPKSDGETAYFPLRLRAYGRYGEPCRLCGTAIERIRLGGRSTFFCPKCQK